MKIVCLIKQVPHFSAIEFDPETNSLKREGVPVELNVFCRYAVQHAVVLREQVGGEVIALTMGPPQAEEALRECLALGADRAIHLSDRAFALADTLGTSRTLSIALAKEGADLVLCGRKTLDSETWQVPPEVAAFLGWPHVTNAAALDAFGGQLQLTRETDFGFEIYEAEPPLVVSVGRAPANPVSGAASDGPIDPWQATDLVDDLREYDKRFGQPGSPTRVMAVRDSQPERNRERIEDIEQAATRILELLAERRPEASPWEKPPHAAEIPGAHYDCWTMIELADRQPRRVSLELLGRGRDLAGKLGGRNIALVFGAAGVPEELGRYGAEVVCVVEDEALAEYHPELWGEALKRVLAQERPHVLLIPATGRGRDYGPRAAGELELGMTGDCVGVDIAKAGRLAGGTKDRDSYRIDDVDVVSLLGSGIGGPEPIPLIEAGAAEAGAAVAGTREVCEAGWLPLTRQVGILGRPVAPRLLVGVGVRGDEEEAAGFVKAGVVGAVGAEEGAPINEAADVIVPGDWRTTLKPLHDRVSAGLR
jgi:electron transfer flavoprotein alpha subunit